MAGLESAWKEVDLLAIASTLVAIFADEGVELFRTAGTVWVVDWVGASSGLTLYPVKDGGEDLYPINTAY